MTPEKFLVELKAHSREQYAIVRTLRNLILNTHNTSTEEIKYGGLLYSNQKPYTGLFVSKNHVSMEFSEGARLDDPSNLLTGSGKYRRHIKFRSVEEINEREIKNFLKQAVKIANM
jgi:hypothetical protein